MSHVDEGTLHAYLDGALDAVLPAGEAARVRDHLASCDVCGARLREERALRDEASRILGLGAPSPGELPPFEELRARAAADSTPEETTARPGRRIRQLAWAASVVVAVGAGWMLRGVSMAPIPASAPREVVGPVAPSPGAAEASTSGSPVAPADARVEESEAQRAPAPAVGDREKTFSEPTANMAEAQGRLRESVPQRDLAGRSLPTSPSMNALDSLATAIDTLAFPRTVEAARQVTAKVGEEPTGQPLAASELQRASSAGAGQSTAVAEATRRTDASPAAVSIPVAEQKSSDALFRVSAASDSLWSDVGRSLAVPGLTVLSVDRLEVGEVAGSVRVRQLLASGDTLEIFHLPSGVRPSALPPARDGNTELILAREDGWLVLRAGAPRPVLDELARRLGPTR